MKKILILSIFLCFFGLISLAQYVVKPLIGSPKTDTTTAVTPKKTSENSPISSTVIKKSAAEQYIEDDEEDEDEFDEKELDELEASIAKAKAALGIKNVSTTSAKSIPSKSKDVSAKIIDENKAVMAAPVTTYESPSLMLNGRVSTETKNTSDFKQTILTEEEKEFYNTGNGLKVNDIDEVDIDSIYISPTIAPSFVGGIDALKTFFTQNLKIPEVAKGQEIKGRVFVRFVIRKDGKVDKVHLMKGSNDECNSEAIRVIKMMPAWSPASEKGEVVSAYYVLPISFATTPAVKK